MSKKTARDYETTFGGYDQFLVQEKARSFRDKAWSEGYMTYEHTRWNEDGRYEITITARKRDNMP